jgi:glycine/D-amino acid oxidase-like deaminating enzyme
MLDWLIIGGGIHGVILTRALLTRGGVDRRGIRILDPHPNLLHEWERRATACGMVYLRSPGAHGLEPDFASFARWLAANDHDPGTATIRPYRRPALELFMQYGKDMCSRARLGSLHVRGHASALRREGSRWRVTPGSGPPITARNVVLALGPGDTLRAPGWATASPRVRHIYHPGFRREELLKAPRPVVVGGGVAAVQLALWCARAGADQVRLLSRSPLRVSQFDSNPCYIGPACMERFVGAPPAARRDMLLDARHPGSVPPEAITELEAAVAAGRVIHTVDEVVDLRAGTQRTEAPGLELETRSNGPIGAGSVALATGFADGSDVASLRAIDLGESELPVDAAGRPVVREDLQWQDGLYVTGRLAEMELGPSAANIIGAHNAAKRIVSSLRGSVRRVPVAWPRY